MDAELSERNVSKKAHREAKQAEISQQQAAIEELQRKLRDFQQQFGGGVGEIMCTLTHTFSCKFLAGSRYVYFYTRKECRV